MLLELETLEYLQAAFKLTEKLGLNPFWVEVKGRTLRRNVSPAFYWRYYAKMVFSFLREAGLEVCLYAASYSRSAIAAGLFLFLLQALYMYGNYLFGWSPNSDMLMYRTNPAVVLFPRPRQSQSQGAFSSFILQVLSKLRLAPVRFLANWRAGWVSRSRRRRRTRANVLKTFRPFKFCLSSTYVIEARGVLVCWDIIVYKAILLLCCFPFS